MPNEVGENFVFTVIIEKTGVEIDKGGENLTFFGGEGAKKRGIRVWGMEILLLYLQC